jgi:hypothetical protein
MIADTTLAYPQRQTYILPIEHIDQEGSSSGTFR